MISLLVDASSAGLTSTDMVRTCRVGGYWEGSSAVASSSDSLSSGGTLRSYRNSTLSRRPFGETPVRGARNHGTFPSAFNGERAARCVVAA